MGFLDKLRGRKSEDGNEKATGTEPSPAKHEAATGRKVTRYTSDGKPVYS